MITDCKSELYGLSTDTKPTEPVEVCNATVFYEMDTGKVFMYDKENDVWHEQ